MHAQAVFVVGQELADAVAFICENDYFNGRILELDGGLRL